jgi:putative membrane protein
MVLGIAKTITAIVALMHIYFLWLEMFAWTTKAKKVFRHFPSDLFEPTKNLAANQGLYNGFLAAGLFWSFFISDFSWSSNVALFFLSCVSIAGIYGGSSVSKKIFFIQGIPAIIAIGLWVIVRYL